MNDQVSFDDFISFIREEIGEFKMAITQSSLNEKDLRVTGDDALELIENYGKRFGVDITGFIFSKYFYPESWILIGERKRDPLTLGNLYDGIKAKKLDESIIQMRGT